MRHEEGAEQVRGDSLVGKAVKDLDLVSVDSTTARAHHHAAGMALDGEWADQLTEADRRAVPPSSGPM